MSGEGCLANSLSMRNSLGRGLFEDVERLEEGGFQRTKGLEAIWISHSLSSLSHYRAAFAPDCDQEPP